MTLGRWNNDQGGTDLQKIGTFIHELGHNLGRLHGGSENLNFKPNHLSVMNYVFQTQGISLNGTRVFHYQRFPLPVDQSALSEPDGLGGMPRYTATGRNTTAPAVRSSRWPPTGPSTGTTAGRSISNPVPVDVNGDGQFEDLLATPDEWRN